MNTAYTNGAEQNTETGKRQMANFAEAAKGMGFALGIYAAAEKSVKEFGSAQQNRTVTEVDSAWSGREGEMAVNLNKHDLGAGSLVWPRLFWPMPDARKSKRLSFMA